MSSWIKNAKGPELRYSDTTTEGINDLWLVSTQVVEVK